MSNDPTDARRTADASSAAGAAAPGSAALGSPPPEIELDPEFVRALLRDEHADLAEEPIAFLDAGFDNALFRLGDQWLVRLPRRAAAAQLIENEQRVLPQIAPSLPIPTPVPLRTGRPGDRYPWPYSISGWIEGKAADESPPDASEALGFAHFLRTLHDLECHDPPSNPVRGVPLIDRQGAIEERLTRLRSETQAITREIDEAWRTGLSEPQAKTRCWLHGDLHARNVIVEQGRIRGIIDWGDVTGGDPATDLASLWSLFDSMRARREALACYATSASTIRRAIGWAILFGSVLLDTGRVDSPRHEIMGSAILRRVHEDLVAQDLD